MENSHDIINTINTNWQFYSFVALMLITQACNLIKSFKTSHQFKNGYLKIIDINHVAVTAKLENIEKQIADLKKSNDHTQDWCMDHLKVFHANKLNWS